MAALAVGASLALAGCGSSSNAISSSSSDTSSAANAALHEAAQACISQWDSGWAARLTATQTHGFTLFARFGEYGGEPGSCSVLIALPDYNGSFYSNVPGADVNGVATAFHSCVSGGGWCQLPSYQAAELPSNWNAHISPDGRIGIGTPAAYTKQTATTTETTETTSTETTSTPTAPGDCGLVKVKAGTVGCVAALAAANAAVANPQGNPNSTVSEHGFGCYVYPYEVDCSGAAGSFSAMFGTVGSQ